MTKNEVKPGSYLIRVFVPESALPGLYDHTDNMIRCITEDDGEAVYVHRDALIPERKENTHD